MTATDPHEHEHGRRADEADGAVPASEAAGAVPADGTAASGLGAAGADPDAVRAAARDLVATGRRVTDLGLSPGSSGNVSVRVGARVLMSPTGASLGDLDPDALSELTLDGELVGGPRPSKEFPFHTAFYRRDTGTRAVVHLHSPHAAAVSLLPAWHERSALPPLTPYFVMRVGQTPLIPYAHPGDDRQARDIEALPFAFRAALLQNHGSVTSGTTLATALDAAIELEEVCRLALLTSGRDVVPLGDAAARELGARYGSPWD